MSLALNAACLCLWATALPAQALTDAEIAAAHAQCDTALTRSCLFTLATDAALHNPSGRDPADDLNQIAYAQARAHDSAGADRSIALGATDPGIVVALGRWDQALAAAHAYYANRQMMDFNGTIDGMTRIIMVHEMLHQGLFTLARQTALSIDDKAGEADFAMILLANDALARNDAAAVTDTLARISHPEMQTPAFLAIARSQIKANRLTDARTTLSLLAVTAPRLETLIAVAGLQLDAGQTAEAAATLTDAATPQHPASDTAFQTWQTLAATLETAPDAAATRSAVTALVDYFRTSHDYGLAFDLATFAETLIALGQPSKAESLAAHLDRLDDGGIWSRGIYLALTKADPGLAPTLLPEIHTSSVKLEIILGWAKTLHDTKRTSQSEARLTGLADWTLALPPVAFDVPSGRVSYLTQIAQTQFALGFFADATDTLRRAYTIAPDKPVFLVTEYLAIAAALPP